jgi:hypothetical protein
MEMSWIIYDEPEENEKECLIDPRLKPVLIENKKEQKATKYYSEEYCLKLLTLPANDTQYEYAYTE